MKWLTGTRPGRKVSSTTPGFPAIAVRVYLEKPNSPRAVLQFNEALLKSAQWQPGDRLMIGVDERLDCIGLVRSDEGHAISGGTFSRPRTGKPKDGKNRPYAAWNGASFPEVVKWAAQRKGNWVPVFLQACDEHQNVWVTRGRSIADLPRLITRLEDIDNGQQTE